MICVSVSLGRFWTVRAADRWRPGSGFRYPNVVKWAQRYRRTGSVAPGQMGGHRKPVLERHRALILERIRQTPHLTLHGLKNELAARGVHVSHNAVWLFLRREGLRFKKKRCSLLSRPAPTSPAGGGAGDHGRYGSIHSAWYLSTRPGSKPAWPRFADGDRRAIVYGALRLMATGRC
jgi:putative transposase